MTKLATFTTDHRALETPDAIVPDTKAGLVLASASVALTGAFVFGHNSFPIDSLHWLMPIGSIAGLTAAALSLRGSTKLSQHWLAAGTLSLLSAAAIAAEVITPTNFVIAASALFTGLAFAFGQTTPKAVTADALNDLQLISDIAGFPIVECDAQSRILASSDIKFDTGSALVDIVHVADRPGFLLACSTSDDQTIVARMQLRKAGYFCPANISFKQLGQRRLAILRQEANGQLETIENASRELAHEMRTPLAAIVGLADALAAGTTNTQIMRDTYPALIANAGRDLIEMTSSILDAQSSKLPKTRANLCDVAQSCITLLQPMAAKSSVTLFNRLPHLVGEKPVESAAMRQVLINLLSNAIKFSPAGSSVELGGAASANSWTLSVTDNGNGISPEDIARLGQKNFRAEVSSNIAGFGLGLSIVRRLVDDAGARISFESRPGKGTKVTIAFPAENLVELSNFQTQGHAALAVNPGLIKTAGEKHAAA